MTFFRHWHQGVQSAQKPHVGPLVGGKLAKASRATAVMRAQDKPTALGRRIIGHQSLRGEHAWSVPDGNPTSGVLTHPPAGVLREVGRWRADVTPGHVLRLSALVIASGQTQGDIGASYIATGAQGALRVDATWTAQSAATTTRSRSVALPSSTQQFGAAPTHPWTAIKLVKIWVVEPASFSTHLEVATWTGHVGVDVTLSHIGGCRVVSAVLHEVPKELAREHDDDADLWTSHIFATPTVESQGPIIGWPFERLKDDGTDPRGGTMHLMDVAAAQGLRLGPQLISWTPWVESQATGVFDTEVLPVETASSSFVRLWDGAAVGYDEDEPGWSISSGAYARGYAENHTYWSRNEGSIPVVVAVYAGAEDLTDEGTVRVQAAPWSWVDVRILDRDPAWWLGYGHLRTGMGPGDTSLVQAFFRRDAGIGDIRVFGMSVYHAGQYAPTF